MHENPEPTVSNGDLTNMGVTAGLTLRGWFDHNGWQSRLADWVRQLSESFPHAEPTFHIRGPHHRRLDDSFLERVATGKIPDTTINLSTVFDSPLFFAVGTGDELQTMFRGHTVQMFTGWSAISDQSTEARFVALAESLAADVGLSQGALVVTADGPVLTGSSWHWGISETADAKQFSRSSIDGALLDRYVVGVACRAYWLSPALLGQLTDSAPREVTIQQHERGAWVIANDSGGLDALATWLKPIALSRERLLSYLQPSLASQDRGCSEP